MDNLYVVARQPQANLPINFEWIADRSPVLSISSRNTIAFTAYCDLAEPLGQPMRHQVYVADLNIPWEAHKVLTHTEEITCLEWDVGGTKLLIADSSGTLQIWTMRPQIWPEGIEPTLSDLWTQDFLLNDWVQLTTANFSGECIIAAAYFHNGKKIGLNTEKKDSVNFIEKFQHLKFGPSVKQMGGRPLEGCIAIGGSGMVCVVVQQLDGTLMTCTEILGQFRTALKVVDICYAKNGDFLVVTSEGLVNSSVHCYHVTLKVDQKNCTIKCQSFSSFYLNCLAANPMAKITHLKFVLREAADAVVVAAAGAGGSVVELWGLREKNIHFHKAFQNQVSESQPKTTVGWQHHASYSSPSCVVDVATPRLSIYDINPPPSYIVVAYKDSTIKCLYRDSMQPVFSINVSLGPQRREDMGLKHYFTGATIKSMQLTWTGCALMAIDSLSQLYLYRLSPINDPGGPMSLNYALIMLEYCLVTGTDWWDVILSLRPGFIETICDKLTDSFNRQPYGTQTFLQNRYLSMKGSLYRCLNTGQAKAGDCHALIMLNAVATALKGMLRPRDMSQDKGPAETLSGLMTTATDRMDNVLLMLEHKEFTVEPPILQSLQHLTQWVSDLALYLLTSLPSQRSFPGGGLISDTKAINTLRELLVIIRIWGFLNESCLPTVTRLFDNIDILSTLFKLLTKLLTLGGEPDETLLDECNILTAQVIVPTLEFGINAQGVSSSALYLNSLPLLLEHQRQPELLMASRGNFQPEGHKTDVIRHVALGARPSNYRQCTRCFSYSLFKAGVRSAATRAWDQRWARLCPCGGHWRFMPK